MFKVRSQFINNRGLTADHDEYDLLLASSSVTSQSVAVKLCQLTCYVPYCEPLALQTSRLCTIAGPSDDDGGILIRARLGPVPGSLLSKRPPLPRTPARH